MKKVDRVNSMTIKKQRLFRGCYNPLIRILLENHGVDLTFEELDEIIKASIETIQNLSVLNDRYNK